MSSSAATFTMDIMKKRKQLYILTTQDKVDIKRELLYVYRLLFFYKEAALQDPMVLRMFVRVRNWILESKDREERKSCRNMLSVFLALITEKDRIIRKLDASLINQILSGELSVPTNIVADMGRILDKKARFSWD